MKVALVCDYLKEYGGAERVLEALHEVFPDAPLFTLVYAPEFLGPHRKRFSTWEVRPSFLNALPYSYKWISVYRLIAPWVFKTFDFSDYDLVIVSATGAYSPNMIKKGNATQICYCHTPPRSLYGYATARNWQENPILRVIGGVANHFLRMIDFASSKNVDHYIANSANIAGRIKKFYRKDSTIIYPPIDLPHGIRFISPEKRQYYVAGGRLARPKHFDVIIKATKELNVPLIIFGKGFAGYGDELKELAGENVEFVGEVHDEAKLELMRHAKAFIFAGEDEDFGMVPLEAMSVGTPVISYRSGGPKETIIEGKTGLFFNYLTSASLIKTIKQFETMHFDPKICREQAEKFSTDRFFREFRAFIKSL